MNTLIDVCPFCGSRLTAVCNVVVEYSISHTSFDNGGKSCQDWERKEIFDDTSELIYVKCQCGREWHNPTENGDGYITSLGEPCLPQVRISGHLPKNIPTDHHEEKI